MLDTGKDAIDVTATVTAQVASKGIPWLAETAMKILNKILEALGNIIKNQAEKSGEKKIETLMRNGDPLSYQKMPQLEKVDLKELNRQAKELGFQYSINKSGQIMYKAKDAVVVALAFENVREKAMAKGKVIPEMDIPVRALEQEKQDPAKKINYLPENKEKITALEAEIAKREAYNYEFGRNIEYSEDPQMRAKERKELQGMEDEVSKMRNDLEHMKAQAVKNAEKKNSHETAKPQYVPIKVSRDQDGNFVYSRGDLSMVSQGEKGKAVRQRLQDTFGIGEKTAWAVWNQGLDLSRSGKANRNSIKENISKAQVKQQADINVAKQVPKAITRATQKAAPAAGIAR